MKDALLAGKRGALARAITLVESKRADHREQASALLEELMPHTGDAIRVGVTGVPGVGKSTFIEALGLKLVEAGHRVAVLAVDPTSVRSGGSILGDKTRMELLSRDPRAFIRPSPSGGTLGGVAARTRETMLLCEAAGYDVVLVETVGVGQSELAVSGMTDTFLVLMLAGAGDELQGIKRGLMEVADALVVHKADGDNVVNAGRAAASYRHALHLLHAGTDWEPPVSTASSITGEGIDEAWQVVLSHRDAVDLAEKRRTQARSWLWSMVDEGLRRRVRARPDAQAIEDAVVAGTLPATVGASRLLE
ncbi:MAG: methylmalonyl Co-A mutase-associated GTPase MeaB [Proteobacteria bacterium]|nr:methylmalonyl Co-A mutase-associated GTPase MeaB [Pseudomonadota bacterium]MCP4917064.1 methylmalonyl Co-A mutase-associated GTPase MeaB [Pseudomonadota bacterium]